MKLLETLIKQMTLSIRIRMLIVLLRMIRGFRILMLLLVALIISTVISISSALTGLGYLIHQYSVNGFMLVDSSFVFCLIVFSVFSSISIMLLLLMSENRWLGTLKIDELVEAVTKNID